MRYEHALGEDALEELSARELTSRLGEQLATLVRREITLARAELFTRGRQAVMGGGLFAGAGVAGLGAYLVLLAAAVAGIAVVLPVWASALIVGGALAALAGALAFAGWRRLARGLPPLQLTTDTVRRDIAELAARGGHSSQPGDLAQHGHSSQHSDSDRGGRS